MPQQPDRIDPIAILREEAIAAAIAHGADRCEELAENLVQRYAQRVGGFNAYVRRRSAHGPSLAAEVLRRHNGHNTAEVARTLQVSTRYVQQIVKRARKTLRADAN